MIKVIPVPKEDQQLLQRLKLEYSESKRRFAEECLRVSSAQGAGNASFSQDFEYLVQAQGGKFLLS